MLHLRPHKLAHSVIILSSSAILTALLLTQYLPSRFRIHPYPYLSDAGLRDPERIIISAGLALSAALFLPFAAAVYLSQTARLAQLQIRVPFYKLLPLTAFRAAMVLALFLALFSAIPGWFFLHHVFAIIFATSSAAWSFCQASITHTVEQAASSPSLAVRVRALYGCAFVQIVVIAAFGLTWGSVKMQVPFAMIPNKDPRFVLLALLEYIGTTAFLGSIGLVARGVSRHSLQLSLRGVSSDVEFGVTGAV